MKRKNTRIYCLVTRSSGKTLGVAPLVKWQGWCTWVTACWSLSHDL